MPYLPTGENEVENIDELIKRMKSVEHRFEGISIRGAIVHSDIISHRTKDGFLSNDNWANLISIGVLEKRIPTDEVRFPVKREQFVIYETYFEMGEFIGILEEISDSSQTNISGYNIQFEEEDYSPIPVITTRTTSDFERYDHFRHQFATYKYSIDGKINKLVSRDGPIKDSTVPSPLGLEQEDPPLLNIHDAVEEYVDFDTRSGNQGKFFVFEPYYQYRIKECQLNPERQEIRFEVDKFSGTVNSEDGLSVKVISSVGEAQGEIRLSRKLSSHHEVIELDSVPDSLYVILVHENEVVDFRRLVPVQQSTPLIDKARELSTTEPYLAGAATRMALLKNLRQRCTEAGIEFQESDYVNSLARKLQERGVIRGDQRGLITEVWNNTLSRAVHLERSGTSEESIQQTIESVAQFISESSVETDEHR